SSSGQCDLLVESRGHRAFELPLDLHRPRASVAAVRAGAEQGVRHGLAALVAPALADEEERLLAVPADRHVAAAGGGVLVAVALGLPVEEAIADRVVVVERGRGVVALALLEGDEEEVRPEVLEVVDAGL